MYLFVYFLPAFVNTIPVPGLDEVELSSLLLSSVNQLGSLQIIGLIQTNNLLLYWEAKAAFTPGLRVAACWIEKIDSVLEILFANTNGSFGFAVKDNPLPESLFPSKITLFQSLLWRYTLVLNAIAAFLVAFDLVIFVILLSASFKSLIILV